MSAADRLAAALPAPLAAFCREVERRGGTAWVVGGAVRDAVLGRIPEDWDILLGEDGGGAVRELLVRSGARRVGRSHPVWQLSHGGASPAQVDLLPRGLDPGASLVRRDLTCNAMAWRPASRRVTDLFGGLADLRQRRQRAVHPRRFGEDPLRALRVARFLATHGLVPDGALLLLAGRQDLGRLPAERVGRELDRILRGRRVLHALVLLRTLRLLRTRHPGLARPPLAPQGRLPAAAPPLARAVLLSVHLPAAARAEAMGALGAAAAWGRRRVEAALAAMEAVVRLPRSPGDEDLAPLEPRGPVLLALLQALRTPGIAARARALGLDRPPPPPLLDGRDLLAHGVPPGPAVGEHLRRLRQAQATGRVRTRAEALAFLGLAPDVD